ncbi:MAG: acyl-ACP--UDP-N-acetylglucosamine O-acyltransferase [Bacteroidales bacterium]|nr:acyl-ACP--UDP-N-acetylglucosamine O-acyltransferase [Bacteroidales bacterium]MCF8390657.1 acyl-ACP--UDP-N-acetylglucosamine O-acyltransferase [Bacteroidales bacterium]
MEYPKANVHPEAKIGKDVKIDAFVTIEKDVIIGDGTWIGPNAVIMNGARIGKNCKIYPGAVISGEPQDLKFEGEYSTAEIGDNTSIHEFATINRGTNAKGKTVVGNNCLLQSYTHVAHDCVVKDYAILGSYAGLAGEVIVDNFAIVSPGSLVHQFVHIGAHVMIQGGSKVTKDIPPFILAGRDPLAYTGINSVGLRRRNFTNESIYAIQEMYRILYQRDLNISDAVDFIEANLLPSKERDEVVLFIRNSKRGIVRGYNGGKE